MRKAAVLAVFVALWGAQAFAQVDFSGEWAPLYHENGPERLPGPELGDYTELPINDAARLRADSWDADRISREAHSISQPTMVMWGENDREVPLRDGERLHREIPASRFIVFRECGHIPHEEYPERFIEVVTDFCAQGK